MTHGHINNAKRGSSAVDHQLFNYTEDEFSVEHYRIYTKLT